MNHQLLALLSLLVALLSPTLVVSESGFFEKTIGNPINLQTECYEPLMAADTNADGMVGATEYITFIQTRAEQIDESYKVEATEFERLPDKLVHVYNSLTCNYLCRIEKVQCDNSCTDGIPIKAILGDEIPSSNQKLYLYEVCDETTSAINSLFQTGTASPSPSPTPDPDTLQGVPLFFSVANRNSIDASSFADNAEKSLDIITNALGMLQEEVQNNLYVEQIGPSRKNKRRVEVRAVASRISTVNDEGCPEFVLDRWTEANCFAIGSQIQFAVIDEDIEAVQNQIITRAQTYIENGTFESFIEEEYQGQYIIYVTTGDGSGALPIYAFVGIAAGAVLVGLFAGRALISNRRTRGSAVSGSEDEDDDASDFPTLTLNQKDMKTFDEELAITDMAETVARGTYKSDGALSVDGSSSNAGSSGWSSSAGVSSLNTGSVDSVEYFHSSLAAIGAASNVHKKYSAANKNNAGIYPISGDDESSNGSVSENNMSQSISSVSRADLEAQIETGDWAAVGATAAILARDTNSVAGSMSSDSFLSAGISSGISSIFSTTSRDRSRAAELDSLVNDGDWEGVVMTAAKFEAEDDKSHVSGGQMSSNKSAADRSFANSSAYSPSVSTNISDTLSNNMKRAEIRAEVEALVRRVVPDEIENIDEMMSQFKGHEEDLLERLRTMQERSIAARQREASRRNAKREAKKLAKEAKKANSSVAGLPPRPSPTKIAKSSETMSLVSSNELSTGNTDASGQTTVQRVALDKAIAAGDWEAVGATAANLGHVTDSSVNTSDFESADESSAYLSSASRITDSSKGRDLDELIENKDWSAVVSVARRHADAEATSAGTSQGSSKDGKNSKSSGSSSGWKIPFFSKNGSADQLGAAKKSSGDEEEEARAQAEIWMSIAEQSKSKGSNAIGAGDAAEWAISRSLKQIEDNSNHKSSTGSHSSVASSNDDDKSV